MFQFICKAAGGKIVPLQNSKKNLLSKIISSYESQNKTFKVTIEIVEKSINTNQKSLYNAFIIRASDHFGNTFQEMEQILLRFKPNDKDVEKWTTKELDRFITESTALLAEHGFNFK